VTSRGTSSDPKQPLQAHAPQDSRPLAIFGAFLAFGLRAFGGPVVQIEGLLAEFAHRRGWLDEERFRRALGVYQVLPGPEAHEMCCYLGTVRGGRIGGIAAGLGFMLPGFVLMLAASALYRVLDLSSPPVAGALAAMQIAACALIARASLKLVAPLWAAAVSRKDPRIVVTVIAAAVTLAWLAPGDAVQADAAAATGARGAGELLGHGLAAGLVTFGGAYTALPYVSSVAAGEHGWMTPEACLDGVAIASVLPAPLVIFGTFVGYQGGGLLGALAFTAGIFLPAFGFTFVGFGFFERLVAWRPARTTLDLLGAAAVGLVIGAALGFAGETTGFWPRKAVVFGAMTPALLAIAVVIVFRSKSPTTAPVLVVAAGALGALHGALA